MQRRSYIQISSLIVFLSIITILGQFAAYLFFASSYLILGITCLLTIICMTILIEQTLSYEPCFIYTFLTLFVSLIVAILTYLSNENPFIPFTNTLIFMVVFNWLIPYLYSMIRCMFDYGPRFEGFPSFYRNINIIFIAFYLGVFIYNTIFPYAIAWAYPITLQKENFIPFYMISTLIEDYIYFDTPLQSILLYLASRILLFIPYGYYLTLLLRRKSRIVRLATLLILPLFIELIQFIYDRQRSDIDDIIYGFLGALIGGLLFYLTNLLFKACSGKNFLAKDSDYRYSNNSLHF